MTESDFPIGHRVNLSGHFQQPVVLEAVRRIGAGYECRVRLLDGSPDEAILSAEEASAVFGGDRACVEERPSRYGAT